MVLIYAGHNEYLGVMGVGSAFAAKGGRLATLMHLKFKGWRLYQLLQQAYYFAFAPKEQPSKANKTLMSKVAREKEIVLDSNLYQQGIEQFKGNMSLILSKYRKAGIKVMLGNLVSNESGQIPFSSVEKTDWLAVRNSLTKASAKAEVVRIKSLLKKEENAENYYQLALNFAMLARYKEAKQAFVQAKDNDLLRFRAPSELNGVIESLAKEYDVDLVNTQAFFEANSAHGIIGNKLILEHLHPTVEGYFLLAEAYAELIISNNLISKEAVSTPQQQVTRHQARADIPVSVVDKLYGDFVVRKLMNDFPFTSELNPGSESVSLPASRKFEKQALIKRLENANWLSIQQDLLVKYQQRNEIPQAAKIAGAISTAMVDNHRSSYIAGQLYQQLNDWQLASYYHSKAVHQQGENVSYLLALAQDYFLLESYQKSLLVLGKANNVVTATPGQKQRIAQYIANVKQAAAKSASLLN